MIIIDVESYDANPEHQRLADLLLAKAGIPAHDTYRIEVSEGHVAYFRYRVSDARNVDGKPVLTFVINGDGPVTYVSVLENGRLVNYDSMESVPFGIKALR